MFTLRDRVSNGGHDTLTFRVGISYNDHLGMSFTLLGHSRYKLTTFSKVRITARTAADGITEDATMYVDVLVTRTGLVDYSIYDNLQFTGWDPINWERLGNRRGRSGHARRPGRL